MTMVKTMTMMTMKTNRTMTRMTMKMMTVTMATVKMINTNIQMYRMTKMNIVKSTKNKNLADKLNKKNGGCNAHTR